ncbi:hypothetical protein ITJ39_15690 [Clavibacter sp. VKM Ac-2542]|nr:hypothetical protein [Clavibacter sp. VKM Ac-2542]MBF4622599.1 hypothetical protein [Clavibacter sp. VKM Ac-2542]
MVTMSPAAEQLLRPASLVQVNDAGTAPKQMGVYGWWFEPGCLPTPVLPHPTADGFELLYVGIAPRKPAAAGSSSKSQLRARLASHAKKDASRSTLRLTLGVLLSDELGLTAGMQKGRVTWGPVGEQALTAWMQQHARIGWVADDTPWLVEEELLRSVPLPLNISGKDGAFTQSLALRRQQARLIARAQF